MKQSQGLSCRGFVALVDDYLDDRLTPWQRTAVGAHLDACTDCATYLELARTVLAVLGAAPQQEATAAAQLLRLRHALDAARP